MVVSDFPNSLVHTYVSLQPSQHFFFAWLHQTISLFLAAIRLEFHLVKHEMKHGKKKCSFPYYIKQPYLPSVVLQA